MARYVALLRGINVGGKGIVKMSALKAAFEKLGYTDVATFIQSGNVLFSSSRKPPSLAREIISMLSAKFGLESKAVVLSSNDLDEIIKMSPKSFGKKPGEFKCDVLFFTEQMDTKTLIPGIPLKEGVDQAFAGPGVLYFSRLGSKSSQSRLSKVMSMPIYKSLTIRNWNTTVRLAEMLKTAN